LPAVDTIEQLVAGLRSMWRIRLFEEAVQALFLQNLVSGSTHLCQGQEAVSVGVCAALEPDDFMTCTYRGHGAVIAMGAPLDGCFAEIVGRSMGLCGGKGGSMHLADIERGALGSFAVVGAGIPVAVGAALSAQVRGDRGVAVTFFGDGSTNIGAFHESLNLASVWKLPCVFVCENNLYGEYSPIAGTTPVADIATRADSYAMPGVIVDGNDLAAVNAVAGEAVERARAGAGPTLIEAKTYRQVGHSRSDPGAYRPDGELDAWLARDPLTITANQLLGQGVAPAAIEEITSDARQEVTAAQSRALASPPPSLESRFTDILA
jgi:TPP-dependent pyruvate/acetoin dehydrogenase alpha subunit